jgi:SAM-dependent methyltransferase
VVEPPLRQSAEAARTRRGSVESGVRTAAIWAVVDEHARTRSAELGRPLVVVDIGGGTGGLAVPLAARGHHVTVVDPSPDALASLRRRAEEVGQSDHVDAVQGDAETLPELVASGRVPTPDLICCHGTLEVVDDPSAAIAGLAAALPSGGLLSLLTAQRLAVVLSRALAGRFDEAREALLSPDGRWGDGDPTPRRFDAAGIATLLQDHGFHVVDELGVRIFTDLVPSASADTEASRQALLALEDAAARHPDFAFLGRLGAGLHVLARRD